MKLIYDLHKLFKVEIKKKSTRHDDEIRQYTKEAIKTYKKTLRKLAHE